MIIDTSHEMVRSVEADWAAAQTLGQGEKAQISRDLRTRLAQQIASALSQVPGQLALFYHEFLTMEPTGVHSFAHGSEMGSKTVYWVSVARLTDSPTLEIIEHPSRSWGDDTHVIRFAPRTQFVVPVHWKWSLYPYYPNGRNQPSFWFQIPQRNSGLWLRREPDIWGLPSDGPQDISNLGDHLCKDREDEFDWATKIAFAIGTDEVERWLTDREATDVFAVLNRR